MLIAAEYMKVYGLILSLFNCFSQNKHFSELNAFKCYMLAYEKGVDPLMYLMMDRISVCFLIIISTLEYRRFQIDQVCELLSSNYIGVQSEIEVFYAALMWLFWDYRNRHKYIKLLFRVIRFKLLPSTFILDWAERLHELPKELANELCPILYGTMVFHQEVYLDCFGSDDFDMLPNERNWIRDNECPYLDLLDKHLAYEMNLHQFSTYLRMIIRDKRGFLSRIVPVDYRGW
ncbi:uncharacterized protein Dwil_GK26927 [Drosophila willistoni]|uniref:BACK domain-containing protein n=2 Tax=Drosophila willistoni TaxID=7260 RepID=A0A0Q9WUM8_DROWI|nr:uncharacterized protein Dwil_GK26927 [Drosophila willistoni]